MEPTFTQRKEKAKGLVSHSYCLLSEIYNVSNQTNSGWPLVGWMSEHGGSERDSIGYE